MGGNRDGRNHYAGAARISPGRSHKRVLVIVWLMQVQGRSPPTHPRGGRRRTTHPDGRWSRKAWAGTASLEGEAAGAGLPAAQQAGCWSQERDPLPRFGLRRVVWARGESLRQAAGEATGIASAVAEVGVVARHLRKWLSATAVRAHATAEWLRRT